MGTVAAMLRRFPSYIGGKSHVRKRGGRAPVLRSTVATAFLLVCICCCVAVLLHSLQSQMSGAHSFLFTERLEHDSILAPLGLHLSTGGTGEGSDAAIPLPWYANYPSLWKQRETGSVVGDRQRLDLRVLPPSSVEEDEMTGNAAGGAQTNANEATTGSPPGNGRRPLAAASSPSTVSLLHSTLVAPAKEPAAGPTTTLPFSALAVQTRVLLGDDNAFTGLTGSLLTSSFTRDSVVEKEVPLPDGSRTLRNGVILFFSPVFADGEALSWTKPDALARSSAARFLHVTLPMLNRNLLQHLPYPVHIFHRGPLPTAVFEHMRRTLSFASAVVFEDVEGLLEETVPSTSSQVAEAWFEEEGSRMLERLSRNQRMAADAVAVAAAEEEGTAATAAAAIAADGSPPPVVAGDMMSSILPFPQPQPVVAEVETDAPVAIDMDDWLGVEIPAGGLAKIRARMRRLRADTAKQTMDPVAPLFHSEDVAEATATTTTTTTTTSSKPPTPTSKELTAIVEGRIRKARMAWQERRFWTGVLWRLPSLARYEYYWQLDVDSVLSKPIVEDVFALVAERKCAVAYRTVAYDSPNNIVAFWETLLAWRQSLGLLVRRGVAESQSQQQRHGGYHHHRGKGSRNDRAHPAAPATGGAQPPPFPSPDTLPYPILFNETAFHTVSQWLNNRKSVYTGKAYTGDLLLGNFAVLRHPLYASFFSYMDHYSPHGLLKHGWSEKVVRTVMAELIMEQEGWNACRFSAFAGYRHPRFSAT